MNLATFINGRLAAGRIVPEEPPISGSVVAGSVSAVSQNRSQKSQGATCPRIPARIPGQRAIHASRMHHTARMRACACADQRAAAIRSDLSVQSPDCRHKHEASDSRARAFATGALRNTRRRSTTRLVYSTPPPYLLPINGQYLRVLFNINTLASFTKRFAKHSIRLGPPRRARPTGYSPFGADRVLHLRSGTSIATSRWHLDP